MKTFPRVIRTTQQFLIGSLLVSSAFAAPVTWDGDTNPNASGTWETSDNWNPNGVPGVSDNAQLLDVTTGTRTVTISNGSPQTINKLTITQTTVGAFNVLRLDDDLTISLSGFNTPFAIAATAGQDSIVTHIAANKTLRATNSTAGMTGTLFAGTLNLGAGSTFRVEALGATSDLIGTTLGGPINVTGAGASIILQAGRFVQNPIFNGAITLTNVSSTLTLSSLNGLGAPAAVGGSITFNGDDGAGNAVNLGTGTEFIFTSLPSTYNFTNRVNLAALAGPDAGGKITLGVLSGGSGTQTVNFTGGLVMGAGAESTFRGPIVAVTLAGTSSMGTGAAIAIASDNAQGAWNLTNAGTFTMDGATVTFDWAAASNNNPSNATIGRRFVNTGTWTLKNAASIAFISSTARPVNGGFGLGMNNENSGTFNLESGSNIGFLTFFNTGTLNLGSSTSGVSDATVILGSPNDTFSNITLTNGLTAPLPTVSVADAGTLNVLGNTYLGRTVGNNHTITLNNGAADSTGSLINVGDSTTPTTFTVANSTVEIANFAGNTFTLNPNSTLVLKYDGAGSTARLTNAGTMTLDNADLSFDYAAASSNTGNANIGRRFVNSGTMTLENGSNLAFITTTSRPTSGFGVGTNNENSGTLDLKSGSTVGLESLFNTGTLNLGSSTLGVSDASVYLGSPNNTFGTVRLVNGLTAPTPTSINGAGTINILGDTVLGRTAVGGTSTALENGSATSTGSILNIGDGATPVRFTIAGNAVSVTNFTSNSLNIRNGGTLLLQSLINTNANGNVSLTNSGNLTHSGTLQMRGAFNGTRSITTNAGGTYQVSGTNAIIEALPRFAVSDTGNVANTTFTVAGMLIGSTSTDKLTYINSTGNAARSTVTIAVTDGEIAPGNGSNGAGISSVGKLELANFNVTTSGAAKLTFDIGGTTASNLFDSISLTGSGGIFTLAGSNDTLDIWIVNGFTDLAPQTYLIVGANSRAGTFDTLLYNGAALTNQYTVNYLSNGIEITLAAVIPEPSSSALLLIGMGVLAAIRARKS